MCEACTKEIKEDETKIVPRVRIGITTTSKGYAQRDITVEATNVPEARLLMRQAMEAWNEVVQEYGIPVATPDSK